MADTPYTRRSFLTTLILLLTAGGLLQRYLTPRGTPGRRVLASAAATEVPLNGALLFREQRLALLRDATGVYALSLVCTHLGCTLAVSGNELACPCHGSRFDLQGKVLSGPASGSLRRLLVEQRGDRLEVTG